jgi:hypothetical protein
MKTMKKKSKSLYNEQYLRGFRLKNGDPHDDRMAHALAELTFIWGRVEYVLFLILQAIDDERTEEWIEIYFKSRSLQVREAVARKKIVETTMVAYPEFASMLDDALAKFSPVRDKRNLFSHGVWRRIGPRTFTVFPMRANRSTGSLEPEIEIAISDVIRLVHDAKRVLDNFAILSTEMLAFQFLERNKQRIEAARVRVAAQVAAGLPAEGIVPEFDPVSGTYRLPRSKR